MTTYAESMSPIIQEIRSRIQFLVTIEIFFIAFLQLYSKVSGSETAVMNNNALVWVIGVAFCIVNYLVIGGSDELKPRQLLSIKNVVSLNIFLFAPLVVLFVMVTRNSFPAYYEWPFKISLWGTLWLPIATFFPIFSVQSWQTLRSIFEFLKKGK
ncbi:MAG: hypothetical protein V1656_01885 [Candidatus Jorgensenbacteria bacterium]